MALFAGACLGALCLLPASNARGTELQPLARAAAERLIALQRPDGSWPAGFDFLAGQEPEREATPVQRFTRQLEAALALADFALLSGDQAAGASVARTLEKLRGHALPMGKSESLALIERTHLLAIPLGRGSVRSGLGRLGLLYEREGPGTVLSPDGRYESAFVGAVAIALLTELRYRARTGDDAFGDLRHTWVHALLALHAQGAGFRAFPTSIDTDPVADGQAWLALAEYVRMFPRDQRVREFVSALDDEMMARYGRRFDPQAYLWQAMAASARFFDTRDARFLGMLRVLIDGLLGGPAGQASRRNRCAPMAGVADAAAALAAGDAADRALAERARVWLAREAEKLAPMQIQPGQAALVFSGTSVIAPSLAEWSGAFRAGLYATDSRLDDTGHCVSAIVKLERHRLLQ